MKRHLCCQSQELRHIVSPQSPGMAFNESIWRGPGVGSRNFFHKQNCLKKQILETTEIYK